MFENERELFAEERLPALARSELGERLNFEDAVKYLRTIRQVTDALSAEDPDDVPESLIAEANAHFGTLGQLVGQIAPFDVAASSNPVALRDSISTAIKNERDWFLRYVKPQIGGVSEERIASRLAAVEQLSAVVKANAEQSEQILKSLRAQSGTAAAITLSPRFEAQARSHRDQAFKWLVFGAVIVVLTGVAAFYFLVIATPGTQGLDASSAWFTYVHELVPRLFVLGVLVYLVTFASRNYRVNKHLQIVYEQRKNALDTCSLFTSASQDESIRNAAAAEIVRAIFQLQDSGYLSATQERTIVEAVPGFPSLFPTKGP